MLGEDDDTDVWMLGADVVGSVDAVHVVAGAHADVRENGVGGEPADRVE